LPLEFRQPAFPERWITHQQPFGSAAISSKAGDIDKEKFDRLFSTLVSKLENLSDDATTADTHQTYFGTEADMRQTTLTEKEQTGKG